MISGKLLSARYSETYQQISDLLPSFRSVDKSAPLANGVNPVYWILGHIVVARVNVLILLGQPSLWTWEISKQFIPSSPPNGGTPINISWEKLHQDLNNTQEQLSAILPSLSEATLATHHDTRSLADHLLEYTNHEAFHTGQLSILALLAQAEAHGK